MSTTTESMTHREPWRMPIWLGLCGFLAIAGFFLWEEHRAHLLGAVPYVLLLLCPAIRLFIHRGHGHGAGHQDDVKNAFHAALELAGIEDFTWHDLRHTFASWLMMRGASLRSVAELLGHQSMKMTMRYAYLSPAFLSAEVSLLDRPAPPAPPSSNGKPIRKRARQGQSGSDGDHAETKVPDFVCEISRLG